MVQDKPYKYAGFAGTDWQKIFLGSRLSEISFVGGQVSFQFSNSTRIHWHAIVRATSTKGISLLDVGNENYEGLEHLLEFLDCEVSLCEIVSEDRLKLTFKEKGSLEIVCEFSFGESGMIFAKPEDYYIV